MLHQPPMQLPVPASLCRQVLRPVQPHLRRQAHGKDQCDQIGQNFALWATLGNFFLNKFLPKCADLLLF